MSKLKKTQVSAKNVGSHPIMAQRNLKKIRKKSSDVSEIDNITCYEKKTYAIPFFALYPFLDTITQKSMHSCDWETCHMTVTFA